MVAASLWAYHVQVHSNPSASRKFSSFKQEMLYNLGQCVKKSGADFAWKDHVEFTNGIQAGHPSNVGKDMTPELASMTAVAT